MNYFTPDLLIRFGSADDAAANAAAEEWEQVQAAYRKHLNVIRPRLPRGARRLLRRFCLHDAKVLSMTVSEPPSFSILLELNAPAREPYLELRYRLAGDLKDGLTLTRHPELDGDGSPFGWWLYDELGARRGGTAVHAILFTGGYELQLTFSSLTCTPVRFVYRAGAPAEEGAAGVLELLGR